MSDDFNIKPVTPLPNVNRLAPADRDRGKGSKHFYEKNEDQNEEQIDQITDENGQNNEQDSPQNEQTDDFSDGHSIDIKA
jgi:hypothetical protein